MIKKSFFTIATAAIFAACSSAPNETVDTTDAAEEKEVVAERTVDTDAANSTINWKGFKTYSKGEHIGTINLKSGMFKVEGNQLVGGEFTIDMNTIHCKDLEGNEENYNKLVGHLKSDDFFAVDEHPEARFVITEVSEKMNDEKGTTHILKGNLTMRDNTQNITIPVKVNVNDEGVAVKAPEFTIDRTNWNVMFGSTGIEGLAKDKLIDDKIILELDVRG
ncbi:MAG: YceI family protein [Cryomorphaceae bacterium]|nr:YceI family protein [Cryomorphaceae bacterium]